MLRNVFLYSLEGLEGRYRAETVSERLGPSCFRGRQPSERSHMGFVPITAPTRVDSSTDPLTGEVHGCVLLRVATEEAAVPPYTIRKATEEEVAGFEARTGRRPSSEEKQQIREDVELALVHRAATKRQDSSIVIDNTRELLLVEAGSRTRADELARFIVPVLPEVHIRDHAVTAPEMDALTRWAAHGLPKHLQAAGKITLETPHASKVSFRHTEDEVPANGDFHAVQTLLREGFSIGSRMSLLWKDRLAFDLTKEGTFHSIKLLDRPKKSDYESHLDFVLSDFAQFSLDFGAMLQEILPEMGLR